MPRTYDHYCSLARALEVVGERWTLLIVRELMLGPKRFKDLQDGLPGASTNLLADRLKTLEEEGVIVRKELPPPAGSRVYELTEDGLALAPAMTQLSRWGLRRLGKPRPQDEVRPMWALMGLPAIADRKAARGVRDLYEVHIDGDVFTVTVADGIVVPRQGAAESPDVTIEADGQALLAVLSGAREAKEAIRIEGDPAAAKRALKILRLE